jgi:hypothetical protein
MKMHNEIMENGGKTMKKFLAIILTLAMALSLVACGGGKTEEPAKTDAPAKTEEPAKTEDSGADVYKIGVVLPMTGGSARMGELQFEGMKLFADYYNENGGIKSLGGAQIELILADSTGDPATGGAEAERLINNCQFKLIGATRNRTSLDAIQHTLELTDKEVALIASLNRGQFLLSTKSTRIPVDVVASDALAKLITTDHNELKKQISSTQTGGN